MFHFLSCKNHSETFFNFPISPRSPHRARVPGPTCVFPAPSRTPAHPALGQQLSRSGSSHTKESPCPEADVTGRWR